MTQFPIVRLPAWPVGGAAPEALAHDIAQWIDSAAMVALVRAFGGDLPPGDVDARLAYLEDFSMVWDARAGGERVDARYVERDDATRKLIEAAAPALGLAGRQRPAFDRYDHVLVLGGGRITGRARAQFAAELLSTGTSTGTVTGLGSLRELPARPGNQPADPEIVTEGDAMLTAVRQAFPSAEEVVTRTGTTADGNGWWVRSYPSDGRRINVVAAPPTRPGQRANTPDTLTGWAELVTRPAATDRVLLVTTDLYVPFQHAEAIRVLGLPHRCGIDTVGFDTRSFGAWPNGPSHPGELLQELRSAIRSLHTLQRQTLHVQL